MIVKITDISFTLSAIQTNLADNVTVALFRREATVIILYIAGRDHNFVGNFNKIVVISAVGTNDAPKRLAFGYLYFLHVDLFNCRSPSDHASIADSEPWRLIARLLFLYMYFSDFLKLAIHPAFKI